MTAQQAATVLLNANYRPDQILKALEDIKKATVAPVTR